MTKRSRRNHSTVFKAKVALVAVKGEATLMRKMGLEAIYQRANTSRRHPRHPVFPYLRRGLVIERPNQA